VSTRSKRSAARAAVGLSPRRWALVLASVVLLLGTKAALVVLPYGAVRRAFDGRSRVESDAVPDLDRARDVRWAVQAVARRLFGQRPCLPQALVARLLLARSGVPTTMVIGAGRGAAGFEAHAWLEWQGKVVVGGAGQDYVPFGPVIRREGAA